MKTNLRPLKEKDLSMILAWRNHPDVRHNMYTFHEISNEEHATWWANISNDPRSIPLVFELNEEPVGFVSFTEYSGENGTASWAFYSRMSPRQRGIGSKMEQAALHYAFEVLKVRRLECEVLEFNRQVVDFHIKHGFSLEGISKNGYVRDGKNYDIYRLAMLDSEWYKWVKLELQKGTPRPQSLTSKNLSWDVQITASLIDEYARLVNDRNPVHLEDIAAIEAGFNGRIAHGMLIASQFSQYFATEFPGEGTIYLAHDFQFISPVYANSTVSYEIKVKSHFGRRVICSTEAYVNENLCLNGIATLLLPKEWKRD